MSVKVESVVVLPTALSAPEVEVEWLNATVIREHGLVLRAGDDMVYHAILAGDALLQLKAAFPYGQWLKWLDSETEIGRSTAQVYMRFARYRDLIGEAPSMHAARKLLTGKPGSRSVPVREWVGEARKLQADGMTYAQVGALVGRSTMAVYKALNPEAAARDRAKSDAARKERQDERNALRTLRKHAAVQKTGGGVPEAYAALRAALVALDRIMEDGATSQARQVARLAHADVAKAEARIARLAMGGDDG